MLAATEDFEIFGAVVGAVVVEVAHDMAGRDRAEGAFGDEALFEALDDFAAGGAVVADVAIGVS
jgi:hypothetical protein